MHKDQMIEKDGVIRLGRTQFLVSYLQSVTMEEAIEHYKKIAQEDRIRNAWKRANRKK